MPAVKRARAFELDSLRGLALFMMILHHLIFDLRYLFGLDVFAFQETWWFIHLLQPAFLSVFLVVSGISCTFSRSNGRRGLRLLLFSLGLTAVTALASRMFEPDFYVFFNILHLLAVGILLYAGLERLERRPDANPVRTDVILLLLAAVLLWLGSRLADLASLGAWWLLPLGLPPPTLVTMADYLPLVPWLGFFLVGTLLGRRVYGNRQSAFPGAPAWLQQASRPLALLGRHSLVIYVLHQPALLMGLWGLRALGLI